MMYVIFEKETKLVYDFKADPSAFLGHYKYGFSQVSNKEMQVCYEKMAVNKICFYNEVEKKWIFEDKPITIKEKEELALSLIREYTVFTVEPLSLKLDEELLIRLNADLDLCADIVVAKGEFEADVPEIDYI